LIPAKFTDRLGFIFIFIRAIKNKQKKEIFSQRRQARKERKTTFLFKKTLRPLFMAAITQVQALGETSFIQALLSI